MLLNSEDHGSIVVFIDQDSKDFFSNNLSKIEDPFIRILIFRNLINMVIFIKNLSYFFMKVMHNIIDVNILYLKIYLIR